MLSLSKRNFYLGGLNDQLRCNMIDTLKTAGIGLAGSALHWTEYVPPIMSALAALATLVYMLIKISKEIK